MKLTINPEDIEVMVLFGVWFTLTMLLCVGVDYLWKKIKERLL